MLSVTVSNPGTGVATGVVVEERIPAGMQHPAGSWNMKWAISSRVKVASSICRWWLAAGPTTNVLTVRGDGNLRAEHKCDIEVVAPQLDVVWKVRKRFWNARPPINCR